MHPTAGLIKRMRRYVSLVLLAALAPLMFTSCYGHFPLTRAVYNMNGDVGSELGEDSTSAGLIQSVVMWVFLIIPVYEVSALVDILVLNLIEFWTDDTINIGSVHERNGVQVAIQPVEDGREALLTVSHDGKLLIEQHLTKVNANTFEMRDAAGNLTGTILKTSAGEIRLSDAEGRVIKTVADEDMAAQPRI